MEYYWNLAHKTCYQKPHTPFWNNKITVNTAAGIILLARDYTVNPILFTKIIPAGFVTIKFILFDK